jgi:hypothetical protein
MVGSRQPLLRRIRTICLALPEASERVSHGAPAFFVRDRRVFVNAWIDGHHDKAFPHLWCAGVLDVQEALVATRPERFFRPPYVGHRGWLGVRLDGDVDWEEIEDLCEDAYRVVAPSRLIAALEQSP